MVKTDMINCRVCGARTKRLGDDGLLCRSCWNRNANEMIKAKQRFVDRIRSLVPCQVCGERDPDVLEFHHVVKEGMYKRQQMGGGIVGAVWDNRSVARIVEEMNRCAIVCANCHKRIERGKVAQPTPMAIPIPPRGNRYNWSALRDWMETYCPECAKAIES